MSEYEAGSPLRGLTVLELCHIAAGPTTGMILKGLGAEVIKVERPEGDQTRSGPAPGTFIYLNRGKRSAVCNLKKQEDKARFTDLAVGCDAIVHNYAPGVPERLGVSYEDLRAINPEIVYGSIAGYPPGPLEDQPALDEVIQMRCGLAYSTGLKGRPMRAGASVVDMTAGLLLALAVVAALREREVTGRGAAVQVSLLEAGSFYMGQSLTDFQITGRPTVPYPERDSAGGRIYGWGIYDIFTTADDKSAFLAVTSDRQWESFCVRFGATAALADPRYKDNAARLGSRDTLVPLVAAAVRQKSLDEFIALCREDRIPCTPVQAAEGLLGDLAAERLFTKTPGMGQGVQLPLFPVGWWSDDDASYVRVPLGEPPALGEWNAAHAAS